MCRFTDPFGKFSLVGTLCVDSTDPFSKFSPCVSIQLTLSQSFHLVSLCVDSTDPFAKTTPRRNFSAVGFIFPHFRSRERKGCVRATWCDLVLMVLDELMVLDKWPIGSQVYVFHPGQINVIHPGQIYCNAIVIDIRCSGMWREVKVHYHGWPCEYDEWILERSSRLDIRTKNDEIDVVP